MYEVLAVYPVTEIEDYLRKNPDFCESKKGYEIVAGCVLAKCYETWYSEEFDVGFEISSKTLVKVQGEKPPFSSLIADPASIVDRDVDIWIANDRRRSKIQITRTEPRTRGKNPIDRLLNTLQSKMNVQSDPNLVLAILVDETFDVDLRQVHDRLTQMTVPYGQIVLIGQMGTVPKLGVFNCIGLYPKIRTSLEVRVNFS